MSKRNWSIVVGVVLLASVVAGGVYFSNGVGEKGAGRIAKIKNFDKVAAEKSREDVYLPDGLDSKKTVRRTADVEDSCSRLELYSIDNVIAANTYSDQFDDFEELFDYFEDRSDARNCRYEFVLIKYDDAYGDGSQDQEISFNCQPTHNLILREIAMNNIRMIRCVTRGDGSSMAQLRLSWDMDTDVVVPHLYQGRFVGGEVRAGITTPYTVNEFDHFDKVIITRDTVERLSQFGDLESERLG